ncbi:Ankyrin repeat domain-containing protein 54 [Phytophthora ramorum]|uniref:Ankyrin repeat domain-containing protein 54 n=1 Tax=Phytophthora ramorum TaxID=164328 RepID=UPI003094DF0B|nr:Ankyrin repeat domain-containing protein 54 [Phytophthora ramorum]
MSSSGNARSPNAISKRFTKARRRGNSQGEALSSGSGTFGGMSPVGSFGTNGRNTISFGKSTVSTSPATPSSAALKDDAAGFVSSKTGFLTKRAMSSMDAFANWKERFFVLAEGHLSYYKQGGGFFNTGKEDIVHLKGELELTPDTIVRKSNIDDKANCFEVVTPTKKMFCQASTAREMEDWVKSVRAHINALKKTQIRGSFHDAPPVNLAASGGPGVMAGMGALLAQAGETDYSRPSMLEDHEIVRGADKSSDPKDVVIKQLLEENRSLREQLTMKDQVIHELETNGGRSVDAPSVGAGKLRSTAPQMILDLRDVKKKQFQLFDAAEVGNWHLIATLLRDNVVDVNGVGINQTSALHLAARNNHPNAVKELLARGADPSARTGDSYTALHIAVQVGNVECVKELLDAGADPNVTDYQGNAAIHMAAETGDIPTAKMLVAGGARIDAPNASGSLPVHLSPIGHPIRVLLGSGSNLAATNPSQPPKPRNEMTEREGNATQAFTDQEISEMERGFDLMDPNAAQVQRLNPNGHKDDKRLFKDFDFTPELQLDNEAKQFEQLALQQNSFKNLPPPALLETDEYSI